MGRHAVCLTEDAVHDLGDIVAFIAQRDGNAKADRVLSQIEKACVSLAALPERGVYPRELAELGIREYREVFFKPYRILYRTHKNTVYVMLIADGRRDMRTLLQQRLLR